VSDSGRQIGDCKHARTREHCAECREEDFKQILQGCDTHTRMIDRLRASNRPVTIECNNDRNGNVFEWVVMVEEIEFWLDTFPTKEAAIAFCEREELNYVVRDKQ